MDPGDYFSAFRPASTGSTDSLPEDLRTALKAVGECLEALLEVRYAFEHQNGDQAAVRQVSILQSATSSAIAKVRGLDTAFTAARRFQKVQFQGTHYPNAHHAVVSWAESLLAEMCRIMQPARLDPLTFPPRKITEKYEAVRQRVLEILQPFHPSALLCDARQESATVAMDRVQLACTERIAELEARVVSLDSRQVTTEQAVNKLTRYTRRLARAQGEVEENGPRKIPPKYRTKPLTLKQAARFMGYGSGKDAAERLRQAIEAGSVRCERLTRQQHVFDKREFPEDQWPQVAASGPN
jgi:hypothetical protein